MLISVKVTFQVRMYCSCKKLLVTCLVMLGERFKAVFNFYRNTFNIHCAMWMISNIKSIPVLTDLNSIPGVF